MGCPGNSHRPQLAVFGRELHLVGWDNRDGNDEIYYKHSADGGRTWGDDVRITNIAVASQLPMIAATQSGPHVIWTEQADFRSSVMANPICRGQIYYLQWRVGGKIKRRSLQTTSKQIAREKLRQFESASSRATIPRGRPRPSSGTS